MEKTNYSNSIYDQPLSSNPSAEIDTFLDLGLDRKSPKFQAQLTNMLDQIANDPMFVDNIKDKETFNYLSQLLLDGQVVDDMNKNVSNAKNKYNSGNYNGGGNNENSNHMNGDMKQHNPQYKNKR